MFFLEWFVYQVGSGVVIIRGRILTLFRSCAITRFSRLNKIETISAMGYH